jgi:putative transposase
MDGRGRCHDNIFVERLWWTVKHEWVYLRPATNGLEQKRSLAEFFDWYNLRRPHQALGWRTPDEAYLGQSTAATALPECRAGAVNLWTVGGADPRLTAQARSPMDKPGKTQCVSPPCPQVGGCPQASQHPATTRDGFDFGEW